jgi:hypothetical protein
MIAFNLYAAVQRWKAVETAVNRWMKNTQNDQSSRGIRFLGLAQVPGTKYQVPRDQPASQETKEIATGIQP